MEKLPVKNIKETPKILKKLISAHKALSQLKGLIDSIPNIEIILNTLSLQESKDSSEIEQIITTHNEIFRSPNDKSLSMHAKEVQTYSNALLYGVQQSKDKNGISTNLLVEIANMITFNSAGVRKTGGTHLKDVMGNIVYTPPQTESEINNLMSNLEQYINLQSKDDLDPLVKMAIIHYQFEGIHPFYDGNGRTGRILNILYLIMNNLLDFPVLYLSGYIIKTKSKYYELLRTTRESGDYEDWILYMLEVIEKTSISTINLVKEIESLMDKQSIIIKDKENNIYSQDLLNIIFSHPYTKQEYLVSVLGVSRQTASKYLSRLESLNLLRLEQVGLTKYFVNQELFDLIKNHKF
jgi:Fic family protein